MMNWNEYRVNYGDSTFFCRTVGEGTPLLLIHGAACDSDYFDEVGKLLAQKYRVICYDRRGYGRTTVPPLTVEVAKDYFISQADDAAWIMQSLAPQKKCLVLGCSYGAVIAQFFAARYTEKIYHAYAHEPPLYGLLPVQERIKEFRESVGEALTKKHYHRALNRFILFMSDTASSKKPLTEEEEQHLTRNGLVFVQYEFDHAFGSQLKLPENLPTQMHSLLLGEDSIDNPLGRCVQYCAEQLDCSLYIVPGGHNAPREDAEQFARALLTVLSRKE